MQILATFVSGLIFGLGLIASQLINPAKVLNFLDVAGSFDASLAVTMAVAVAVAAVGYRVAVARNRPLFAPRFHIPALTEIDARLIGGATLFGIGWGLAGICPGPAIAALAFGSQPSLIFTAAMLAGMSFARLATVRVANAQLAAAKRN